VFCKRRVALCERYPRSFDGDISSGTRLTPGNRIWNCFGDYAEVTRKLESKRGFPANCVKICCFILVDGTLQVVDRNGVVKQRTTMTTNRNLRYFEVGPRTVTNNGQKEFAMLCSLQITTDVCTCVRAVCVCVCVCVCVASDFDLFVGVGGDGSLLYRGRSRFLDTSRNIRYSLYVTAQPDLVYNLAITIVIYL
jgi:hypothetical protein